MLSFSSCARASRPGSGPPAHTRTHTKKKKKKKEKKERKREEKGAVNAMKVLRHLSHREGRSSSDVKFSFMRACIAAMVRSACGTPPLPPANTHTCVFTHNPTTFPIEEGFGFRQSSNGHRAGKAQKSI